MKLNQKLMILLCGGLLCFALFGEWPTSASTGEGPFDLVARDSGRYVKPNGRKSEADRMARLFLPEVGNDTSPRLRDMVQVLVTPNEMGFGQSTKAQEAMTARGTDSGAILVAGVSPDTNGEVGATQRVKIVNKGYQIFDNLTGTSVLGPSDISTIWAGFGGSCETGGAGDPVVLYDKVADRWVFSQFASATGGKAATEECFAVSTTGDATGSYYRYAFHLGANFVDSPHLSVQADGYLMGDSVYNESSTERLGNQFFVFDRTAMLAGTAATFASPGIDTGVGETYSISADGVRLASGPGSPTVSTLTINLTYASDATFTTAGLSATDIVNMKAANTFAASQFTNNFKDPINVNIFVTAVPGTGTLGGSNTSIFSQPFTTGIRDPTRADATTADDATMAGAGGSVPAGLADPIGGTHNWWVTKAQRKALSIAADDLTTDGTYTFGGGQPYTYDPNNRAVAGKYDYIGVSMHEFSEIMGRIGGLGGSISGSPAYLQMDLFHYTAANTRGLTKGAGRSFSIDNGTTLLKAFNFPNGNGSDAQDWASGTNDSFNAFSSSGVKNDLTAVDLRNMDVIGYNFGSAGCALAQLTSPANGSIIQPTTTFSWNTGSGNDQYWLYVGTTAGGDQVLNENQGTNTSRTVSNLPAGTIYVSVWSHCASSGVWTINSSFSYTVPGTTCALAQLTSPANGSTIQPTTTFTWNTGSGNNQYWLYVGTTSGGNQIYTADQGASTSRTLSNLPAGTIYVTVWSHCASSGVWGVNSSFTYTVQGTTCALAQLTSPANGSTIQPTTTFTWNTGTGNNQYWLYVGTTSGGNQIYTADQGTSTSRTVSNLPPGTIYVTVWSHCASTNVWSVNSSFTYTVQGTSCALAQLTSPANGSTIQPTTTFTWNTGTGNNQYWLYVGTTPGGNQIYTADQGTSTSRTLSNLPAGTIYVTVWSHCASSGAWGVNSSFSYQVQQQAGCALAQLTSPANGSTIQSTTTFSWNTGSGNYEFWLYVGTTSGGNQIFSESQGANTSRTVSNLPGGTIFVTVWSHCASTGAWGVNSSFTYQVQQNGCALAQMTSPANGATISSTTTFNWNTGSGNYEFWLYVGTTSGGTQILNEYQGANTSRTVSNLPAGTIFVTLWSHCASTGAWGTTSYSYTR